jgi:hypothetical protein
VTGRIVAGGQVVEHDGLEPAHRVADESARLRVVAVAECLTGLVQVSEMPSELVARDGNGVTTLRLPTLVARFGWSAHGVDSSVCPFQKPRT